MPGMTGDEFKSALKRLGISQRKFASETKMSISAVNEWARDRATMPGIAVAYIELRLRVSSLTQGEGK